MPDTALPLDRLPPDQRLALAYAPRRARAATLAAFALDNRLADLVRQGREPILAQMRLAWWRERLGGDAAAWPRGEPVLAMLRDTGMADQRLAALVDGWEALLAETFDAAAAERFADGRTALALVLADAAGTPEPAELRDAAVNWALADLSAHISDPAERAVVDGLADARDWSAPRLPRALRPLAVLAMLRVRRGGEWHGGGAGTLLRTLRVGIMGR